jgi:hypothetical protein
MTRLSLLVLGAAILTVGCGSSPTDPSGGSTTTFTVPLSSANEVPAITNADAGSGGTAVITLSVTKDDSGTITSATMSYQLTVAGFPEGSTVTKAHIHNAGAGANGGIVVDATLASGELALVNGGGSITKSGISVPADRAAALINDPAAYYFNVHTALNPDGAIRGQFGPGTTTAAPGSGGY